MGDRPLPACKLVQVTPAADKSDFDGRLYESNQDIGILQHQVQDEILQEYETRSHKMRDESHNFIPKLCQLEGHIFRL